MNEYEITLEYIGKGEEPKHTVTEYGFGINPPIVVKARDEKEAIEQLKLSETVKVNSIKKVG